MCLIYKMLDCTVLQSAGALEERISLVQKKRLDKWFCCKHLFDEFDPKHHVQRYVRDPQATPHSISKACKNKEINIEAYIDLEELNSINAVDSTFYECCNLATTIHKLEQTKSLLSMDLEISLNFLEDKGGECEKN